jgi:hypothetical protein
MHIIVLVKDCLVLMQVGDECIVAPLSLFQPELFGVTGPKLVHIQQRASGDPEDPHDENYLRETSVSWYILIIFLEFIKYQLERKYTGWGKREPF